MTIIRDGSDIHGHDGEVVQVVGRYAVATTGRHQVIVTLPDGTTAASNRIVHLAVAGEVWIKLGVRPDEEIEALTGKTVAATGTLIASPIRSGSGAQPDSQPTLVKITAVVVQP